MEEVILKILPSPYQIVFIVVGIIMAITAAIIFIEIKLRKKAESPIDPDVIHVKNLRNITESHKSPKEKLDLLNNIIKEILNEKYDLNSKLTYYDLANRFKKKNQKQFAEFFQQMANLYYAEKKFDDEKINLLVNTLIDAMKNRELSSMKNERSLILEQQLISYIQKNIRKGYTKEDLKKILLNLGVELESLEKALAKISEPIKTEIPKENSIASNPLFSFKPSVSDPTSLPCQQSKTKIQKTPVNNYMTISEELGHIDGEITSLQKKLKQLSPERQKQVRDKNNL